MEQHDEIAACLAALAHELPFSVIEQLTENLNGSVPLSRDDWTSLGTSPPTRAALLRAYKVWQKETSLPASALAFGLRVAMKEQDRQRSNERVELVWSGPLTPQNDWRQTEPVLLQLIESAQHDLWLVTFAAYRVESLVQALNRAVVRGVTIHFIGETRAESGGKLSRDAIVDFGLPAEAKIYVWPRHQRSGEGTKFGVLHAKCAVADARVALVSSANLTENALNLNMEAGVLIHGTSAARLQTHLANLVVTGFLVLSN